MNKIVPIQGGGLPTKPFRLGMSYEMTEATTYEEWELHGEMLFEMAQKSPFLIGDWANQGEAKLGEIAAQALDDRKIDYKTLANYKWVSSRIEPSRRRENLPFGHHEAVAALDLEQQDEMLDLSVKEGWTRADLRKAIKALNRFEGEAHGGATIDHDGESEEPGAFDQEVKCPRCNGTGVVKSSSIKDITDGEAA